MSSQSSWTDTIVRHLADIATGTCRIDEGMIDAERDFDRRQILVGLLLLHEDLGYERQQREQAQQTTARVAEERERILLELRQAVEARDQFLAIASHELRTPITTLSLQIENLLALTGEDVLAELRERRLPILLRQLARLSSLVSQMLDVSRLTRGHLELERSQMNLAELAAELVERFRPELSRRGIELDLTVRDRGTGCWDWSRIDQVVTNLLSNAIKYGRGRPISVSVWTEGSRVFLAVRDQGIGIDPSEQEMIFAPFARAVSSRQFAGLGLGLWISQQIVSASGGAIRLDSHPGAGSTFTMELPA